MISHELRIGNWVEYHDAQLIKVTPEIIQAQYNAENAIKKHCWVYPIPITKYIFEQAGFTLNTYSNNWEIYKPPRGLIGIDNEDFSFFIGENYNELGFVSDLKSCCKYVHQLQNLYFSLFGEEIQIHL